MAKELKDVKVRVGVVDIELHEEFYNCETNEQKMAFLERHKNKGTKIYENLEDFQEAINDTLTSGINMEVDFVYFIPYEGWL